jgi:hypothetical protein
MEDKETGKAVADPNRPVPGALKKFLWLKNLEASRQDTIKIITYFTEKFGLTEDEIRVYFSGQKGFHVLIDPVVLGIQPDKELNKIYKFIMYYLEAQLGLKSIDRGIYSHGRMLRLVNSIHHKSGLFKVELYHTELKGNLEDVLDNLAKAPRPELYNPDDIVLELNDQANDWYLQKKSEWQEAEKTRTETPTIKDDVLSQMEGIPTCVQFILDRGILKVGDRNKATMALAGYYKDIGTPMEETIDVLTKWAEKIPRSLTSSAPSEVRSSTASCVKTIYGDTQYHFGCAFIRSLHGERKANNYEVIPCAFRTCPAHETYAIDQEPAEFMHLAQTANAEYTGKKVAFNALVSGKLDTPYIVPKKVRYVCHHEPFCDKDCILHDYAGVFNREFHENERFLIEATNQNDNNLKGILRHHAHAGCNKVVSEVQEHINVSEFLVVPMAERIKSIQTSAGELQVDETGNEYVTRKVYGIGNEIQTNQYYEVEGYVYSHPKNAMATVLSQKHKPLDDSIAKFELTEEHKELFKSFQAQAGETIDDRITLIINDLVSNVTGVRERDEAHLALLLTYHSCLNYFFQDKLEKRGWLEMILVGDSGQAKSQLVDYFMEFCGLGTSVSGEGSSRTGLVYKLEQIGERWFLTWGAYPLSDRKLIKIDEYSELNPEDFGKITEARTSGVLKIDRVVKAETNARVRMLLLTNPARSRTLSSFTHGCESLKPLFASPADIRRLDLAVFLQSGEIPKSVLNQEYEKPKFQVISSEAMRDSILWAWSRRPEHIEITKPALRKILKQADYLGDKYGYAQDIPLMEPADLRKKIARMAIALAMLTHSTDEAHEKVIVLPEHVDYIADYICVVYDNKNCMLDAYSFKAKEETELTEEEKEEVTKALENMDFGDNSPVSNEVIDLFKKNDILKPQEIMDMLGYERKQVNDRLAILTKHSMIKRTREGLRKLPKFIEYLNS